jgi:hypothetical protein
VVYGIQVKLTKISYIGNLFNNVVYSGFGLDGITVFKYYLLIPLKQIFYENKV